MRNYFLQCGLGGLANRAGLISRKNGFKSRSRNHDGLKALALFATAGLLCVVPLTLPVAVVVWLVLGLTE